MASKNRQNRKIRIDDLLTFEPLNNKQQKTFNDYRYGKHLLLHGIAGTGKSFMALYLALEEVLDASSVFNRLIIVRSIVPTRDIGFLPGTEEEKTAVYEAPYRAICTTLFDNENAYDNLKEQGKVVFTNTSFIRGLNIDNAIVIVDETQNLSFHELDSVITRMGNNTRTMFCGDYRQSDLHKNTEKQGIRDFMKILHNMPYFSCIEFEAEDIVRSTFVKDYIIAKYELGFND